MKPSAIWTTPPALLRPARDSARLILGSMLASFVVMAAVRAEPRTATIVGLGATTCQRFNDDVKSNPAARRDYLAWAQGFMSGILLGRPPGVDQGLDLDPPSFGLVRQIEFLEEFCRRNNSKDFADAVEALYKRLRTENRT